VAGSSKERRRATLTAPSTTAARSTSIPPRVYARETDLSEDEAFERIRAGMEAESLDPDSLN
jgi:hypothetical protein